MGNIGIQERFADWLYESMTDDQRDTIATHAGNHQIMMALAEVHYEPSKVSQFNAERCTDDDYLGTFAFSAIASRWQERSEPCSMDVTGARYKNHCNSLRDK